VVVAASASSAPPPGREWGPRGRRLCVAAVVAVVVVCSSRLGEGSCDLGGKFSLLFPSPTSGLCGSGDRGVDGGDRGGSGRERRLSPFSLRIVQGAYRAPRLCLHSDGPPPPLLGALCLLSSVPPPAPASLSPGLCCSSFAWRRKGSLLMFHRAVPGRPLGAGRGALEGGGGGDCPLLPWLGWCTASTDRLLASPRREAISVRLIWGRWSPFGGV
jgi:hypothetical protein